MSEQKYRLKKDARQFFPDTLQRSIMPLFSWHRHNISMALLEEMQRASVIQGYRHGGEVDHVSMSSFKKQGKDTGVAELYFTIEITEMTHENFHNIEVPDLMDTLQKEVNNFFKK